MASSKVIYAWPCSVNVANFVTVRLSSEGDDKTNIFKDWKAQMVCLLESQDVMGFVNGEIGAPEKEEIEQYKLWRRTDRLVKGWIFGSVGRDVLHQLRGKDTARDVWLHLLDNIFKQEEEDDDDSSSSSSDGETGEDYSRYLGLYKAAMRGDWETAKNFFPDVNDLSTTIISSNSSTVLHIAVLTGKSNDLVNKLVELIPRVELALKDDVGETALHNAATVGNTAAASALVNKNPDLLRILCDDNRLPVRTAAVNCHKDTLQYLISQHEANFPHDPLLFEGQLGVRFFNGIIGSEYIDIALDLAHKYPNLTLRVDDDGDSALSIIAFTDTLFPRTDAFTWWQNFIYHCIPVKTAEVGHMTYAILDVENLNRKYSTSIHFISRGKLHASVSSNFTFVTFVASSKIVDGLISVGKKLESMIWFIIENLVPQVKELREKKARRAQALQLANYLCNQIVTLPHNEASSIFGKSINRAAMYGISELVEMIINKYPMVTFSKDPDTGMNILLLAASYRFENIINLLYNMSDRRYMFFDSTDDQGNNLLHTCGKLAPSARLNLVAGAALQMQRELQWFKEMENFVHPSRRTWFNNDGQTPQMIFTKEHEKLKADGERWMKDTANACTIAAALIATVVFAAAFTVPGGIESASGKPLLSTKPPFLLFAVSDAISLFTSITSLLMFLSILTSRYAEEDFLYVLPKRLSMGLLSLFVSITFMMAAFCATLYLVLQRDVGWFVVLLMAFACLPVASFVLLQFPLLVDVIYSTYGPGIFSKKTSRFLY